MEIEELDEKNALLTGMTKSQAQYKRIEGEKRIKLLLVLDKYVEYTESKKYKKVDEKLYKKKSYREVKRKLKQYPFDGGHFKCDVSLYCALLCEKRFRRFLRKYDIEYDLHKILAINLDQLNDLCEHKLYLNSIRRSKDVKQS